MIPPGYDEASGSAAWFRRGDLRYVDIRGRAPERMLSGVLAGAMPVLAEGVGATGRVPTSALLTAKGRLVTVARLARLEPGEAGSLLLELPGAGADAALDHLARYLPPRFARAGTPEPPIGCLSVVGPRAAETVATAVGTELVGEAAGNEGASTREGDAWRPSGSPLPLVVRSGDVGPPAFDVIGHGAAIDAIAAKLRSLGVVEGDGELWRVLRLEKGRPAFGHEMDQDTLPQEAGIEGRAIDFRKGCFTGQEVVVRIRDRGHVNRTLRGLLLGRAEPPADGTPLFAGDAGAASAPAGMIRSSVRSPRFGQIIALAYVRREVEPPASLRLGSPDGPEAHIRALDDAGWVLVEGDSAQYP